jgi:predicted O-methyltransferase YrrM
VVGLETRTELDTLYEIGIEDEYRPAHRIPATTIVDLGASVGLVTLRLLSSHPDATVLAVEADPALLPRLRANVADLPVKGGARCYQRARRRADLLRQRPR